MNLNSDYITQLTNTYFSTTQQHSHRHHSSLGGQTQSITSIVVLAEIFNQYIDSAQKSNNFKNSKTICEDKELLLALSHNLLFLLNLMKNNNITYKDLFDDCIKHNKDKCYNHPEWPTSIQNHSID